MSGMLFGDSTVPSTEKDDTLLFGKACYIQTIILPGSATIKFATPGVFVPRRSALPIVEAWRACTAGQDCSSQGLGVARA